MSTRSKKGSLKNEIPKSYRLLEDVIKCYIEKGELRKDLDIQKTAYMITSCTVSLENYEFDEGEKISDAIGSMMDILINGIEYDTYLYNLS